MPATFATATKLEPSASVSPALWLRSSARNVSERVLAGHDKATPGRQQQEIAVAPDVLVAGLHGARRGGGAAQAQQRHRAQRRDRRRDGDAPAPACEVRDPGQRRAPRSGPATGIPRLADAERDPAAVAREGEQHEAAAGRRRGWLRWRPASTSTSAASTGSRRWPSRTGSPSTSS